MSGTRRLFPVPFRREAVDRVATSGLSRWRWPGSWLHETMLRRWMVQFGAQATGGDDAWRSPRCLHGRQRLRRQRRVCEAVQIDRRTGHSASSATSSDSQVSSAGGASVASSTFGDSINAVLLGTSCKRHPRFFKKLRKAS